MRQPADPVPLGLGGVLAQYVELHVHGAVQRGGLRDGPPPQRPGGVPGPRDADDTEAAQGEGDGSVLDLPGDLPAVVVLLGVVEHDLGGQLPRAHPQQQMVPVRPPPLPQPRPGPRPHRQHDRRIGNGMPPVVPLGDERVLRVLLDPLLLLLVLLDLLGVGLAPVLLVVEVVGEEQNGTESRHDQVVPAPEDRHGHDRADDRRERHQPGQRPGFVLAGRRRQPEVGLLPGGRSRGGRL